jgi:hypothetical protein
MVRSAIFGHRYRFAADGDTMSWTCERCGALDREDHADLGRRAPLIGLLPLRVWRVWRDRK